MRVPITAALCPSRAQGASPAVCGTVHVLLTGHSQCNMMLSVICMQTFVSFQVPSGDLGYLPHARSIISKYRETEMNLPDLSSVNPF